MPSFFITKVAKKDVLRLLSKIRPERKKQLAFLQLLSLLASISEIISIGAIIPFLGVISGSETVINNPLVSRVLDWMSYSFGKENILLYSSIFFIIAVILAGIIRLSLLWFQTRLGHLIGNDLNYEIYNKSLHQPYQYHISNRSSKTISVVSTKVNQIVNLVILPLLNTLSSVIILSFILVALVSFNPKIALSILFSFIFLYFVITAFSRRHLYRNSALISEKTDQVVKLVQEGLGGIRDILIDGTQEIFSKQFKAADYSMRKPMAANQFLSLSPRYIIEMIAISILVLFVYLLGQTEEGIQNMMPVIGLLAISAQRILPLIQNIYFSWSRIKGSSAILSSVLALLDNEISISSNRKRKSILFEECIELDKICFKHAPELENSLTDFSLKIKKGVKLGVIGPTGSGKSTFLDILMGLIVPTGGNIYIDSLPLDDESRAAWQKHIAHIPQNIFISDSSLTENIAFGVAPNKIDHDKVHAVCKMAKLHKLIETWGEGYQTILGEGGLRVSGGQKQRIGIARALYKNASILILDEATSALDSFTEEEVMSSLEDLSKDVTIVIVAHRLNTLKNCDQIIKIENGKASDPFPFSDIKSSV